MYITQIFMSLTLCQVWCWAYKVSKYYTLNCLQTSSPLSLITVLWRKNYCAISQIRGQGLLKGSPASKQLSHGYTTVYLTLNPCKHFWTRGGLENHLLNFKTQFSFTFPLPYFILLEIFNVDNIAVTSLSPDLPTSTHTHTRLPLLCLHHTIAGVHGVGVYVLQLVPPPSLSSHSNSFPLLALFSK